MNRTPTAPEGDVMPTVLALAKKGYLRLLEGGTIELTEKGKAAVNEMKKDCP